MYGLELAEACRMFMQDIMRVKNGETVAIVSDTGSDMSVVTACADVSSQLGAEPIVMNSAMREDVTMDPPKPVAESLMHVDVVVDLAANHHMYTATYDKVLNAGKARWSTLAGRNAYGMIKTFKGLNLPKTLELGKKLVELTVKAKTIKLKSKTGTDISGINDPATRPIRQSGGTGVGDKPGLVTATGQVGWTPIEDSVSGTVAFDSMMFPRLGVCHTPITCTFKEGKIVNIEGGLEAQTFAKTLKNYNDPNVYYMAHFTYGFHPGMPVVEFLPPAEFMPFLERTFGGFDIGLGTKGPQFGGPPRKAAIHTDGGFYHPSIWLDDMQIEEDGRYIHPEIVSICKELKVPGY